MLWKLDNSFSIWHYEWYEYEIMGYFTSKIETEIITDNQKCIHCFAASQGAVETISNYHTCFSTNPFQSF